MKEKYNSQEFINTLNIRKGERLAKCPFCGSKNFSATDSLAAIMISQDKDNLSLGPCIPSGMLICTNCGHIDFFSLGVLGLLKKDGKAHNGGEGTNSNNCYNGDRGKKNGTNDTNGKSEKS